MSREPIDWAKIFRMIANLIVATICGLAFGITVQGFIISLAQTSVLGSRDFVVFWATGVQLVHHVNPYDPVTLLQVERAAGLPAIYNVLFMRNLPLALPLVYPLGLLRLRMASILWSLLLFACLFFSVFMLWRMNGSPKNIWHWLGYSFGPALICLIMGQTTLFALLGLVLFLRLHRTYPLLAGISLWLCMLKPHLFLPFGVVLLAWIVVSRSYRIMIGAALALAVSFCLTYRIDPMAWAQYAQMARTSGVQWEYIPCVSILLRVWISKGTVWLQYLPSVAGCVWALVYYWKHRVKWDWANRNGSLLMLVSLIAAPYSWIYDAGIVIPALLQGAYLARSRWILMILAFLSALVEVAQLGNLYKPGFIYFWTIWSAPAWLVWYLIVCTSTERWKSLWMSFTTRVCKNESAL
jgi:hypothetical protein